MEFECEAGCGSSTFSIGDDGFTYCSEGHRQWTVSFWIFFYSTDITWKCLIIGIARYTSSWGHRRSAIVRQKSTKGKRRRGKRRDWWVFWCHLALDVLTDFYSPDWQKSLWTLLTMFSASLVETGALANPYKTPLKRARSKPRLAFPRTTVHADFDPDSDTWHLGSTLAESPITGQLRVREWGRTEFSILQFSVWSRKDWWYSTHTSSKEEQEWRYP